MTEHPTLDSVLEEFKRQPDLLRSLVAKLRRPPGAAPIIVGAGDSYAAGVCASYLAGPPVLALDPYSLSRSISWARGRVVCIVSVSGETRSNVELAKALKGQADRTVAVTGNPDSSLASAVDEVVELPFRPTGKAPGMAIFALSLAAVLKLSNLEPAADFRKALSGGSACARGIRIATGTGITHFASNNEAYGVSVYGAAKIYELTGGRAQVSLLEEFSHMPLFSLTRHDTVNIVDSPGGKKGGMLKENLKAAGYPASLIEPGGAAVERLFALAFSVQKAAIDAAVRKGMKAPYFLGAKERLKISDAMIY